MPRQDFYAARFQSPAAKLARRETSLFTVCTYAYIHIYTYIFVYVYTYLSDDGAICMLVLVLKPTGDFRRHSFYTYENSTRIPSTPARYCQPPSPNENDVPWN